MVLQVVIMYVGLSMCNMYKIKSDDRSFPLFHKYKYKYKYKYKSDKLCTSRSNRIIWGTRGCQGAGSPLFPSTRPTLLVTSIILIHWWRLLWLQRRGKERWCWQGRTDGPYHDHDHDPTMVPWQTPISPKANGFPSWFLYLGIHVSHVRRKSD